MYMYSTLTFSCNVTSHKSFRVLLIIYYYYEKMVGNARLYGETDLHPIGQKTPAPQYKPIERKKRMGKK